MKVQIHMKGRLEKAIFLSIYLTEVPHSMFHLGTCASHDQELPPPHFAAILNFNLEGILTNENCCKLNKCKQIKN